MKWFRYGKKKLRLGDFRYSLCIKWLRLIHLKRISARKATLTFVNVCVTNDFSRIISYLSHNSCFLSTFRSASHTIYLDFECVLVYIFLKLKLPQDLHWTTFVKTHFMLLAGRRSKKRSNIDLRGAYKYCLPFTTTHFLLTSSLFYFSLLHTFAFVNLLRLFSRPAWFPTHIKCKKKHIFYGISQQFSVYFLPK